MTAPGQRFELPPGLEATEPPERRGVDRGGVRLLTVRPDRVEHRRFDELPALLEPGDVLVVNTSPTLPAALDAQHADGSPALLHVAAALDDGSWVVEPRLPHGPDRGAAAGDRYRLRDGTDLVLERPHPHRTALTRLWRARPTPFRPASAHLLEYGRPITYDYLTAPVPLAERQNVYASAPAPTQPGSAEMASAGRPITAELVVRLLTRGVVLAPLVLHAGVSSQEKHEPPTPERFAVPAATARLVNDARAAGSRVVAVGTTVVRALETAARLDGEVVPAEGWTDLVLGPQRRARTVDGLISGLHPPEASHLELLVAVVGEDMVATGYDAAVAAGYLWHEFGDSTLFLP